MQEFLLACLPSRALCWLFGANGIAWSSARRWWRLSNACRKPNSSLTKPGVTIWWKTNLSGRIRSLPIILPRLKYLNSSARLFTRFIFWQLFLDEGFENRAFSLGLKVKKCRFFRNPTLVLSSISGSHRRVGCQLIKGVNKWVCEWTQIYRQ